MDRISKEREQRVKAKLTRQTSLSLINVKGSKSASPATADDKSVTPEPSRLLPHREYLYRKMEASYLQSSVSHET